MTNYKDWDYNVEGNKMDKVCRKLLCDELVSDKIVGVIDVGDNNIFWKPDIDLLLVNKFYKLTTLELKADGYDADRSGVRRVFLEYIGNDNRYLSTNGVEGRGNVCKCKAEFFVFYFIKTDQYLIMKTKQLQEWLEKNQNKYPVRNSPTRGYNGDVLYNTWGVLVPVKVLIEEVEAELIDSRLKYKDYEAAYLKEQNAKKNKK